jgi:hypothetical protein
LILLDELLMYTDKLSMAHSIECVCLNKEVVENGKDFDLPPCFRTKLSMICAKERGREYVEEQAHGSADDSRRFEGAPNPKMLLEECLRTSFVPDSGLAFYCFMTREPMGRDSKPESCSFAFGLSPRNGLVVRLCTLLWGWSVCQRFAFPEYEMLPSIRRYKRT